jgi:integrase
VSWFVQKRIGGRGGKQIRTVIGHLRSMTIDEARRQATIDLGKIAQGEDVSLRKKARLEMQRKVIDAETIEDVFTIYFEQRNDHTRYWKEVKRLYDKHVLPTLGKKTLLLNITKEDIRALQRNKEIKSQKYIEVFLKAFFKWAIYEDYITQSPMEDLRPLPPSKEEDRTITEAEIKLVWDVAGKLPYPWGQFIKLLLLTAQRRDEVAGMRWTELSSSTWYIPKERTKTATAHIVHLSPLALQIISTIPKRSDCVFSTRKNVPIIGFGKTKRQIDSMLPQNMPHWTLHALRRTASTGMQDLGIEPWVIEKILNHALPSRVAKIYQRHEYLDERRDALNKWSAYIEGVVNRSPPRY